MIMDVLYLIFFTRTKTSFNSILPFNHLNKPVIIFYVTKVITLLILVVVNY
jgi:hypothetical protein